MAKAEESEGPLLPDDEFVRGFNAGRNACVERLRIELRASRLLAREARQRLGGPTSPTLANEIETLRELVRLLSRVHWPPHTEGTLRNIENRERRSDDPP